MNSVIKRRPVSLADCEVGACDHGHADAMNWPLDGAGDLVDWDSSHGLRAPIHASFVLQRVREEAPADYFTLSWLVANLHTRSYGMLMLLLALAAVAPGVSVIAGLLLMGVAFQMIVGHAAPTFPRRIALRPLPTRYLAALVQRTAPSLKYLEKFVHPRWPTPAASTKRVVGSILFLLSTALVFSPIPLSNIVPALVVALISVAFLEEDGLVLSIGLVFAAIVFSAMLLAVWGTILGGKWIGYQW